MCEALHAGQRPVRDGEQTPHTGIPVVRDRRGAQHCGEALREASVAIGRVAQPPGPEDVEDDDDFGAVIDAEGYEPALAELGLSKRRLIATGIDRPGIPYSSTSRRMRSISAA